MIQLVKRDGGELDYGLRVDDDVETEGGGLILPFSFDDKGDKRLQAQVVSRDVSRRIAAHRFTDIPEQIALVELQTRYLALPQIQIFAQDVTIERQSGGRFQLLWALRFYLNDWKEPFSVREYTDEFNRRLDQQNISFEQSQTFEMVVGDYIDRAVDAGLSIIFDVDNSEATIEEEFFKHQEQMQKLHEEVLMSLSQLHSESVSLLFDFPDNVKVPCEQYLLYFGQFLTDLGVKADTALTHEAGQVLFTVRPTDEKEALDKIRQALDVYLHLASSAVGDTQKESIAAQRLEANILRLRSDLRLAAAELQAKQTTLEAQQLIITVQKAMLSGEILLDSMKDVTPKAEDKEDLIEGVVALSVYREKGVEVNLGELLRRFKRLLGKKDA